MGKQAKNNALDYERTFEYARGVLRTPVSWQKYFWDAYYRKVTPFLTACIAGSSRVVFIGIGSGDVVPSLRAEDRVKIIGIDVNFRSLVNAREHAKVAVADGSNLPFLSGSADLVICNQVLHHITGQGTLDAAIGECARILKQGGRFIAIEPNSFHPSGMLMNLAAGLGVYHLLSGGSDYEFSISPRRIQRLLNAHGFVAAQPQAITFSHPRFPIFVQRVMHAADRRLSRLYLAGLINIYSAVKS
jgi:ubiquinone/menaquinone biosynthesis C-methylase UbiE